MTPRSLETPVNLVGVIAPVVEQGMNNVVRMVMMPDFIQMGRFE
jgi:hypothetical protein